jgi:hypothetical protein
MEESEERVPRNPNAKSEFAMMALTAALDEHTAYLKKHLEALESLTKAVKQLETVIKKEIHESARPSHQLKEAVKSFVDYNINPHYYRDSGYLKLKTASQILYPDFTATRSEKSEAKTKVEPE